MASTATSTIAVATAAAAAVASLRVKAPSHSLRLTCAFAHTRLSSSWSAVSSSPSPSFSPACQFLRLCSLEFRHSLPRLSQFCTAPSADATVSTEGSESSKSEAKEEDNVKDAGNLLDIRVGRIVKAWRHEEADSLYVEKVDLGEAEPRTICSGLVNYVPLHLLQDAAVVVLANLKPRNMRGVKSHGMLLAASDASHENVELLIPPEGSLPGDRVWFGTEEDLPQLPAPASPNQIQKKKIWELVQPHLKTDASCVAMLGEHLMCSPAGTVSSKSLKNANIS